MKRVGLEHAAVHERAGVAFVGVADEVAGLLRRRGGHGPFLAGRDSRRRRGRGASSGVTSSITHCGSPLLQHLGQGLEAAVVEVLLDALRVDHAVVPQGDAALAVEEGHVAVELEELPADRLLPGTCSRSTTRPPQDVLADDLVQVGLVAATR